MLRIALRTVVAHRVRLLLTALSAVLGVAFVTGMLMLTSSLDRTFSGIFGSTAQDVLVSRQTALDAEGAFAGSGGSDAIGSDAGESAEELLRRSYIPAEVVDRIGALGGVQAVAGTATGQGIYLLDSTGEVIGGNGPPAIGLTWLTDPALAKATITEGREPRLPGEVVVDELTFPRLGVEVGDRVGLIAQDSRLEATVVGSFRLGDSGGLAGATLTAFVPEQAQGLLAQPGYWTTVEVAVSEDATDDEVAGAIRAALGPGYDVQTREEQVETSTAALQEGLGFFTRILVGFAAISLFVAAFLIYNTFTMLVAQRGRELALLRAVGAVRSQVWMAVLVEALIVAVIAAVGGVALGFVLAIGLKALLSGIGLTLTAGIGLTSQAVITAIVLGLVVTVVSALLPAWRASRTPPMAALRETDAPAADVGLWRPAVGLVVAGLSGWVLGQALGGQVDAGRTAYAAGGLLIAGILLAPALAKVFARLTAGVLSLVGGAAGRIAGRNAGRTPGRVAATAAALMIGLALVSGVTVIVASAQQSVSNLVDRTFIGDLLITMQNGRGFSPAIAEQVESLDGVQVAVSVAEGPAEIDGEPVEITAIGAGAAEQDLAAQVAGGSAAQLLADRVVVTQSFAEARGLAVGEELSLLFPSGVVVEVAVAAVAEDNPLLEDILMPLADFRAAGGDPLNSSVFVALDGSRPAADVVADIDEVISTNPVLQVLDQSQVKEQNAAQLDQLLYLIYAMLGLSVVIAGLGVLNTMALSVIERTREFGLLRAVGASRRQVRRMVRWEAVLVAVLGGALGAAIGVFAGAALRRSLQDDGIEVLVIPWATVGWVLVAAVVIGVLGAILPARRAARLDILRAIATE